jgi:hypothetical protein
MTDQISFPPLLDLSYGELQAHKQHLISEIAQEPERRRLSVPDVPALRLHFVLPAAAAICAAVLAVVFIGALGASHHPNYAGNVGSSLYSGGGTDLAGSLPTLAHPLPSFAKQTTLGDATAMLGTPVILPDTPLVQPSDDVPVWVASLNNKEGTRLVTTVAVTFPSQGVIIEYTRPAPSDGAAAHFQAMARGMESPTGAQIAQEITLRGGVPALAVNENSDETGHNFGEVIFNMSGSEVRVMGHSGRATLESLALSILSQSGS